MNHHHIKIHPEHYNNVKAGTKTFEIRKSDRPYQKRDMVTLEEYSVERQWYTGEKLTFQIGDVYPIDAERVVFSLLKVEE